MIVDKFDTKADALANLYRASYYMAKDSRNVALSLLKKADKKIKLTDKIKDLTLGNMKTIDNLYWAELILDEYHRLKLSLLI